MLETVFTLLLALMAVLIAAFAGLTLFKLYQGQR